VPDAAGMSGAVAHQPPFLVSRREAARLLGLSVRSVEYLLHEKQLDSRRIGKKRLILYDSILELIQSKREIPITRLRVIQGGEELQ